MLKNYLKIALRTLRNQKIFSTINIFGLTIGLTAVLLIALNIKFEYSFNSFNENENRIFRIGMTVNREGKVIGSSPEFVAALGPAMMKDMPEVENFVRVATLRTMYLRYGDRSFKITDATYADSSLFNIFSFPLLAGNKDNALVDPYSLVLTQSTASKIFGKGNPMGKALSIGNVPYLVTGIVEDPPANSDVQLGSVISFSTLYNRPDVFLGWNGGNQYITYVKLRKNASAEQVDEKFPSFLWPYINKEYSAGGWKVEARLEPLKDIHLYHNDDSAAIRDNIGSFSAIAIFILLIACANFVNLSTARATGRAKEVGMRRVLGAQRKSLVFQFLTESVLICLLSLFLALVLVELLLPWYNSLIDKHLVFSRLADGGFVIFLLVILIVTGVVAGLYPALFLSSYRPASTLRGNLSKGKHRLLLRKSLVIFQFAISIVLIVSTFVISDQLQFMRSKYLGFDRDNILVLPLADNLRAKYEALKAELKEIPGIVSAAASSNVPLNGFTSNGYLPQGYHSPMIVHVVDGDEDFLNTFGIKLISGRNFSRQIPLDKQAYLINESLTKLLGWSDPIGKKIERNEVNTVIGEVGDFNYSSLLYPIEPLIITDNPESGSFECVSVKYRTGNLPQLMGSIEKVWHEFAPTMPFEYRFLDQEFDNVYRSDIRFRESFLIFSGLAIFVSLLGLLGLVSYSVELRRKEIGIRKVLGSSVLEVLSLLSKEYLKWVIAANPIAWPVAYIVMHKWLENFAYRTSVELWSFVIAAVIVALVAVTTIVIEAIKAASENPVESLRYE